jgi:hypothetical protein
VSDVVAFVKADPEHGAATSAYTAWLETQIIGHVEQIDDHEGPRYWLAWEPRTNLALAIGGGGPTPFGTRTEAGDALLRVYRERRPLGAHRHAQSRYGRIERAGVEVSRTWHEWMTHPDGDGFGEVVTAIGQLREALGDQVSGHGGAS